MCWYTVKRVEYFAENLAGFQTTKFGWVQSYGSRCVKPAIVVADIEREKPMTVEWSTYAQSLTSKQMKGMLTGPVTILCWTFPREDISRKEITNQLAFALRDEVSDLQDAGINIIQIDEPAIREGLPLKKRDHAEYLEWAVDAFKISAASAKQRILSAKKPMTVEWSTYAQSLTSKQMKGMLTARSLFCVGRSRVRISRVKRSLISWHLRCVMKCLICKMQGSTLFKLMNLLFVKVCHLKNVRKRRKKYQQNAYGQTLTVV